MCSRGRIDTVTFDLPRIIAQNGDDAAAGTYGSLTITAGGDWTDDPDTDALDAGDTPEDSFTVTTPDTTTQRVVITVTGVNEAPTADARTDREVTEGETITLDGSGSNDPEDETLIYTWSQISGTTVTLSGADTATPTFTAPTSASACRAAPRAREVRREGRAAEAALSRRTKRRPSGRASTRSGVFRKTPSRGPP